MSQYHILFPAIAITWKDRIRECAGQHNSIENSLSMAYTFTVFTPAYNRAHTLPRVYESLCRQTFQDFEWLIVDDGSTDDTREVVLGWQASAPFPIRYIYQPNQGKHIAFNRGVAEAQGQLFAALDSDDALVPDALSCLLTHWMAIPEDRRDHFVGVTGLCLMPDGSIVPDRFPLDVLDSDTLELQYKLKVSGEKWGILRVDILRKYPFPAVTGANFVPEGIVWAQIARRYKTRFVNDAVRVYHQDTASAPDQLTRQDAAKHSVVMALWHQSILNDEIGWFVCSPAAFLRSAVHYIRFSLHAGKSLLAQRAALKGITQAVLWLAALPLGLLVYRRDRYSH